MPVKFAPSTDEIWNYPTRELTRYKGAILLYSAYKASDYEKYWSRSTTSATPVTYYDVLAAGSGIIYIPAGTLGLSRTFAVLYYVLKTAMNGGLARIRFTCPSRQTSLTVEELSFGAATIEHPGFADLTDLIGGSNDALLRLEVDIAGDGINESSVTIYQVSIYGVYT